MTRPTKHSKTSFLWEPGLGSRLRDLRKRRGLSLRQLALLMDRHRPGSHNLLAKLEHGDIRYPSINLVGDYLRACGAGFADLLDLLNRQTARQPVLYERGDRKVAELLRALPPAEQRAMLHWEKAVTAAGQRPPAASAPKKRRRIPTEQDRLFRVVWSFIHANWNEVLEQKLFEALLRLKPQVPKSRRRAAARHCRRMFGVLTRQYASDRRRELALRRAEQKARNDEFSDEVVATLLAAATEAHSELLLSGRLDWEPTEEQLVQARGRAPRVEKAETRLEAEELKPQTMYLRAVALVRAMVRGAVNAELERLRLDFQTRRLYLLWLDKLTAIAVEHGAGSAEWQSEVERAAPLLHDASLARKAAAIAADAFDRWRTRIPPRPQD